MTASPGAAAATESLATSRRRLLVDSLGIGFPPSGRESCTGLPPARPASPPSRPSQPRRASASISTSRLGSISPATATIVAAGRISPKTSPWTADTAAESADVGDEHPGPHDIGQGEPALGQGPLDDREDRPGLARDVARMQRRPVRPGIGRARHPARVARRRSPGCSRRRLPRAARRDPPALAGHPGRRSAGRPPARRGPRGRGRSPAAARRAAWSAARSSRPRGTPPASGRCRRSGPARRASARPSRRSCSRPTRRRSPRRATSKPRRSATRLRVVDEPAAALELLHRPPARHDVRRPSVTSGTVGRGAQLADRRLRLRQAVAPWSPARRPRASHRSATTLGRVPPAITPTFTVTPGQRPLSAWSSRTMRAASRIALRPFSGSTPACAARPWTVMPQCRAMPLRADTMSPLARAHSSTSATRRPRRAPGCAASSVGEPISSSGLATNVRRSNGRPPASSPIERLAARRARRAAPTSCR